MQELKNVGTEGAPREQWLKTTNEHETVAQSYVCRKTTKTKVVIARYKLDNFSRKSGYHSLFAGQNCRSIICLSHADRPTAEQTNICTITCSTLHCCTSPARKLTLSLFLKHDAPMEFVSIVSQGQIISQSCRWKQRENKVKPTNLDVPEKPAAEFLFSSRVSSRIFG